MRRPGDAKFARASLGSVALNKTGWGRGAAP
jgi:hypothetical protein